MRIGAQVLLILGAVGFSGCIFDSRGLSRDAYVPFDKTREVTPDLEADQGRDLTRDLIPPDLTPDIVQVCANNPQSAVCFFEGSLDTVGQTGTCSEGQFQPARYCFKEAPCKGGICTLTEACEPCPSPSCTGVCTVFQREQAGCCMSVSENGEGEGADLCEHGYQCKSGLCTLEGNCYQVCNLAEAPCPAGTVCGAVQVTFANRSTKLYAGCKRLTFDAGVPDLGAVEAGRIDAGSADAARADVHPQE